MPAIYFGRSSRASVITELLFRSLARTLAMARKSGNSRADCIYRPRVGDPPILFLLSATINLTGSKGVPAPALSSNVFDGQCLVPELQAPVDDWGFCLLKTSRQATFALIDGPVAYRSDCM